MGKAVRSAVTPTVDNLVDDAVTRAGWSGGETTGGQAYDTALVFGDGAHGTPDGVVVYSFFDARVAWGPRLERAGGPDPLNRSERVGAGFARHSRAWCGELQL